MARTDAIVLGAGIVGISAALHLAKRGLAVALVDRRGPGEETSYGNAGVHRGQYAISARFPVELRGAAQDRAEARAGGELSSLGICRGRAVAARLSRQHPGGGECRLRRGDAAALCARDRRARSADAGIRRHALSAQGRLAQALSQRGVVCRDNSRTRLRGRAWPAAAPARARGGPRARALTCAGVPPRRALAGCRERVQSARRDQGLCGAVRRARRRRPQGRRAHAASLGRPLAGRHRRGPC